MRISYQCCANIAVVDPTMSQLGLNAGGLTGKAWVAADEVNNRTVTRPAGHTDDRSKLNNRQSAFKQQESVDLGDDSPTALSSGSTAHNQKAVIVHFSSKQ